MVSTVLRTRSTLIGLGALLLGLVVIITLHRFEPEGLSVLGGKALRSLHGPGFAAIAVAIGWGLRGRAFGWWRIGIALIVCGSISLLAELSQVPGPRNAEIMDLVVDGAGIVTGLGLVAALDSRLGFGASPWTRRAVGLVSLVAFVVIVAPTIWLTAALVSRNANVPVLLSFESRLEHELYAGMRTSPPVTVPAPDGWTGDGDKVGHATASGRWGTMLAIAPYQDWQAFEAVSLVAASATGDPVNVGIMLRSDVNYYKTFKVGGEPKTLRIAFADIRAAKPDFNFARIRALVVSAAEPGEPYEVLLDDIRLEL